MIENDYFQVAAYQGKITEGTQEHSLEKTLQIMQLADQRKVDILCMPESYLHGYFDNREQAFQHSLDLQSTEFSKLCEQFKNFSTTTLLLGLNERDGDTLFNTVVVIEKGNCLGKYRKAYTYVPYEYFSLGREFPVFDKRGIKYGIIICLDSAFREPAQITALNGARILFCPSFNRVQQDARMLHYLHRKNHFIARAFDNQCWLVCSDIVWDQQDGQTCPGYSCILNNNGDVLTTAEPFTETLLTYFIPIKNLLEKIPVRLLGTPDLFEIVKNSYNSAIKK
jgi:predicted amidohydrolase